MDETRVFHLLCHAEFSMGEQEVVERTYDISFCSVALAYIIRLMSTVS
jgi:hypothetical protein